MAEFTGDITTAPERATDYVGVSADIARFAAMGLLPTLLADRSTGGNIIWASSVFVDKGDSYAPTDEILVSDVTGDNAGLIRTRASKAREAQAALTRAHAEVFTPTWVVDKMVDAADEAWWEANPDATWRDYVSSPRLEITCGEAPYLVGRYDAADGTPVPLDQRVGILDRKLAHIPKYFKRRSWISGVLKAVQSTYGYEFQGDSLLIARVNVLATVEDWCEAVGFAPLTQTEYERFAEAISWNLWQMDGISDCVPFGDAGQSSEIEYTPTLFDVSEYEVTPKLGQMTLFGEKTMPGLACVCDWRADKEITFRDMKRGGCNMRFDYVIGNPPYNEDTADTSDKPVYDQFMNSAFDVSDRVLLITPARFLFNAGKTPKDWNEKMLADKHFKVLSYYQNSRDVFPNNAINGGIVITYRDATANFGAIRSYSQFEELNRILRKVRAIAVGGGLSKIVSQQNKWNLDVLYADYPEYRDVVGSGGRERRLTTSIFSTLSVFHEEPAPGEVGIIGLIDSRRCYRYIDPKYLEDDQKCFGKWKVIVASGDGAAGTIGLPIPARVSGVPSVLEPNVGFTQTFIGFGAFDDKEEADNLNKYIKTKFVRAMLGTLKVTQHNHKDTWANVPMQDFTSASEIDWLQPISDIDQQLYEKYGLDDDEVAFIESHVKEMS
ncbi:MAG: Eco57I restriction-modification methylase domain-containing protein [Bifidobacteriaceae bacterium]|nr:Eco57I restriction-modification methylase domain-containing protein [Bifidobacteriaceae bacterium]